MELNQNVERGSLADVVVVNIAQRLLTVDVSLDRNPTDIVSIDIGRLRLCLLDVFLAGVTSGHFFPKQPKES